MPTLSDGESGPTNSAAERELASRRKDLEREFDDKLRDLKAQHKRQADKLAQDRADWEDHKRRQAKELADKAEKVHRAEGNAAKVEAMKAAERKELEALRLRVKELEQDKLDARTAATKSLAKAEKARGVARSSGKLVPWFATLSIVGGLVWLATAWGAGHSGSVRQSLYFLALAVGLTLWHLWSIRRTRG